LIKSGLEIPPGSIIFEDPPGHNLHRSLLSRVFTPRKMNALEPKVRDFCASCLDPLIGSGGFDLIAALGVEVPMRTIGMLLGIPEEDQLAIRDQIDESLRMDDESVPDMAAQVSAAQASGFEDYIAWREEHPSDDVMTELLNAEYEDEDGTRRRLTRTEVLNYVNLLAAAGNETTTRLIGWAGKVLAENPDQRADLAQHPELIPQAVEELLRFEPPSPVQARFVNTGVEHHGRVVPAGSVLLLLNGSGNRDERKYPDPDRFDVRREFDQHLAFGYGVHLCLGAALARLEARAALDELIKRFPEWEVDWEQAKQARTSTVRGWERLPIIVP
ncbi:MAG TPA: cytochrome P450, partial [Acidimicrobiales bacterium]|nr:cytochrome P450 [Acidimicrobiales bacterium]